MQVEGNPQLAVLETAASACCAIPAIPMRTRGFEPPTTAFSALRVYRVAPRPQKHRARFELASSGFGDLRSHSTELPMRCRRRDSNPHNLSSELSASAMLRHDGVRISDGEPGNRTPMSFISAVFGTAALPIRPA